MTKPTKKKNTAKPDDGNLDVWQRLWELADSFSDAAYRERSEGIEDVAVVLGALYHDPEFRRPAFRSYETHMKEKWGSARRTQKATYQF